MMIHSHIATVWARVVSVYVSSLAPLHMLTQCKLVRVGQRFVYHNTVDYRLLPLWTSFPVKIPLVAMAT